VIVSGGAVVPGSRRAADVPADGTATPANGAAGR
jgi:hypothetical protein